jgi:hypothetical protein
MEMGEMFSLKEKVCITLGIVGALVCSVLGGLSFWSIQSFLLKLDMATLQSPFFYLFVGSFVGVGGSVGLIAKKPSVSSNVSKPKPDKSSEKSEKKEDESVVSSGASGAVITLLPGTILQNESGTTTTLEEPWILWPKIASEVPVETEKKKVEKKVTPRFFERVED